jgi:hypothetical protein
MTTKAMALPSKGVVRFPRKNPLSPFLRYQPGKANTTKHSLFLVPIADTTRTTATIKHERGYLSLSLSFTNNNAGKNQRRSFRERRL